MALNFIVLKRLLPSGVLREVLRLQQLYGGDGEEIHLVLPLTADLVAGVGDGAVVRQNVPTLHSPAIPATGAHLRKQGGNRKKGWRCPLACHPFHHNNNGETVISGVRNRYIFAVAKFLSVAQTIYITIAGSFEVTRSGRDGGVAPVISLIDSDEPQRPLIVGATVLPGA